MKWMMLWMSLMMLTSYTYAQEVREPVVRWTFDETLEPVTGTGAARLLGGTTTHSTTLASGWRVTDFPEQLEASGTAGVEFMFSTVGFESLMLTFGHRASGTASRWAWVQFTSDGGENWTSIGHNGGGLSPHDVEYPFEFDLSEIPEANDNPLAGIRVVSIFSPEAFNPGNPDQTYEANSAYQRARASGGDPYSPTGNWRLLNVTVTGVPLNPTEFIITQWSFDDTLSPAIGEGTAELIGGVTTHSTTLSAGWRITDFPEQATASGTAGARFDVNTSGFSAIRVRFQHRASGTASRWAQLQITSDGGENWITAGNNGGGLTPHDIEYPFTFDLSSFEEVNDNAQFGFRVVSIFSPESFNPGNPDQSFPANEAYHRARVSGGDTYLPTGNWRFLQVTVSGTPLSGTSTEPVQHATKFLLEQNFPNPFNPSTIISYQLEQSAEVRLSVYTLHGQRLVVLDQGMKTAGQHQIRFDGNGLASGMYFYRLQVGNQSVTRKMTLLK